MKYADAADPEIGYTAAIYSSSPAGPCDEGGRNDYRSALGGRRPQALDERAGGQVAAADRLVEGVQVGVAEAAGRAEGGAVVLPVAQVPAPLAALAGQGLRRGGAAE